MAAKKVITAKAPPAKAVPAPPAKKQPAAAKAPPPKSKAAPAKAVVATITLKQLAAEVAEHYQLEKRRADDLLTGLVGLLVGHLKSGDRLRIAGLGILEVKDRPERAGRNPATGEPMTIKASRKIAFRPAKELKDAI